MRFSSFFLACSGALTAFLPALPTLADTAVPQETVAQEEVVVVRRQVVLRRRREPEPFAVRYVDRPLTLPRRTLSLELEGSYMHESQMFGDDQAGELSLAGAYGITDDFEIEATPLGLQFGSAQGSDGPVDTSIDFGTARIGATYRFAHAPGAEVGARIEFGGIPSLSTLHLSWGLPVVFHASHVFRLDTGVMFTALFPVTSNQGEKDIAFATVGRTSPDIAAASPGLPFNLSFQLAEPVFVGVDTGLAISSFYGDIARSCIMPLGFRLGGTIPANHRPLMDLTGTFNFPYFLVGSEDAPFTGIWQLGLGARLFLPT